MIRPARRPDIPALIRLRIANAERHVQLDPEIFRIPEINAVQRYFEDVIDFALISVAELDGEVVGMVEVVPLTDPPSHQILVPRRGADIHTVVLDGYRGRGVGAALVVEAQRVAAARGVSFLFAGIFATNEEAVAFYSASGFGPRGIMLSKSCD